MSSQLTVDVRGLCAFVDHSDHTLDILMVNALFNPDLKIPEHTPVLSVPNANVDADLPFDPPDRMVDGNAFWDLSGYAVAVQPVNAPALEVIDSASALFPWQNFEWLADLKQIFSGAELRTGLTDPDPTRPRVNSVVSLTQGVLEAAAPSRVIGFSSIWGFPNSDSTYHQAFTDTVRYLLETDAVEIVLHSINNPANADRTIRLRAVNGGDIQATLTNEPTSGAMPVGMPGSITHFPAFAELLVTKPDPVPDPQIVGGCNQGDPETDPTALVIPSGFRIAPAKAQVPLHPVQLSRVSTKISVGAVARLVPTQLPVPDSIESITDPFCFMARIRP